MLTTKISRFTRNDSFLKTFWVHNTDDFVKSRKTPLFVIPAEAGIQSFQMGTGGLDSGFHRSDDFLRVHQYY